jgi:secreted trypsin-like serine protease
MYNSDSGAGLTIYRKSIGRQIVGVLSSGKGKCSGPEPVVFTPVVSKRKKNNTFEFNP